MRAQLQPAYVLHQRPYRDTSLLLEVFTATQGRISLVGKGVRRRARGGTGAALLQPFTPLLLSFSGRSELKNLNQVEPAGAARALRGDYLFSGMYINELLVRLLHKNDPHPALFAGYGLALEALESRQDMDGVLRRFELGLLDELGYSFSLVEDGRSGEPLDAQAWYGFESDVGLVRSAPGAAPVFHSGDLLAAAQGDFSGAAGQTAKRLMRLALAAHLGDAPLRSRELFRARRAAPAEDG